MIPDAVLAATRFGTGMRTRTRAALASCGVALTLPAGAELFCEGERTPFLVVVRSGHIGLFCDVPGRPRHLAFGVEAGDIVGWSVFVPPYQAVHSAVATIDSEVLAFDGDALRARLETDPVVAGDVYDRALRSLSRRIEGPRGSSPAPADGSRAGVLRDAPLRHGLTLVPPPMCT